MTPKEVAYTVEFGEAEAYADMYQAAPMEFASQVGLRTHRVGSAIVLTMATADILLFNRVLGLGLKEPATEAIMDDIIAHYQGAGVKNFGFQLSPEAQPAELPAWLQARGLAPRDNWAKVSREPAPPPQIQTALRVEAIGPEHARAFAEVAATAFEMPPFFHPWLETGVGRPGWRHYIGWDGDGAAAIGALFVKDKIGWLGMGATLPSHRGRGGQGAIIAQRIRDAITLGCEWIVTETGEETPETPNPSFHNMVRTGFRLAYARPNYMALQK